MNKLYLNKKEKMIFFLSAVSFQKKKYKHTKNEKMLSSEKPLPKKKKCVATAIKPKVFKVPSLMDITSAYVANEMLYEKCIHPAETGWYKSRWECIDRVAMPFGCHIMTIGQWKNGERFGLQYLWHCRLFVIDRRRRELCDCTSQLDSNIFKNRYEDWIAVRRLTHEYTGLYVGICGLQKTYDASRNVTLCTSPESSFQFKSKLFKTYDGCWGDGWTDGFKRPLHWADRFKVPNECLTEAFFPVGEMPHTSS